MRLVWSENARNSAREVARYIYLDFGEKARQKFLKEIEQTDILLRDNPLLGRIEPLLENCKEQYRSIVVNRLSKIIYYINGEVIEIVALWDTRREPLSQVEEEDRFIES